MRSSIVLAVALAIAASSASADVDKEQLARAALTSAQRVKVAQLALPALDLKALDDEDAINDKLSGLPHRFAVPREVDIRPGEAGRWSHDKHGRDVWNYWVKAPDAAHLNFGFTRFELPPSARLMIVAADGSDLLGPYTAADRPEHGQLWTPILYGDKALLQLSVDPAERDQVDLQLTRVGQGYRGFGVHSATCKSGSCNTDVACLAADDPWNLPRHAVGGYSTGGSNICTGSLVNNTRNDGRMLFATASHCGIDSNASAASVVVYWNYESPTCRVPGSAASGQSLSRPSTTSQGLKLLARTDAVNGSGSASTRSDWTLLELVTPPAGNNFDLYWAGWDRSPPPTTCAAPSDPASTAGLCASIHQPSGDEKRITFVQVPMTQANYGSAATGLHWDAPWDPTPPMLPNISPMPATLPASVTEPGSSGSPLYNADHRLIGVLSGGPSSCGATGENLRDYYGGLFHAWDGLGTASTRMKDYLDPDNSGASSIDGYPTAAGNLSVTLSAPDGLSAGTVFALQASASGQSGAVTYEWDTDGDGSYERSGNANQLRLSYPSARSVNVKVRARDANGASGTASQSLQIGGPQIEVGAANDLLQVCGNTDGRIDRGERWQVSVQLTNTGNRAFTDGFALFAAPAASSLELGPNSYGYRGTAAADSCAYNFVDIGAGGSAVAALPIAVGDEDDGASSVIVLGGTGFNLYGEHYTQAVMSTNGYVSFDPDDDGGDFSNACGDTRASPRLKPLHEDLVVESGGGLRYRYFASCPRSNELGSSEGCHVFQWSGMSSFDDGGLFEFEAIAYEDSGQVSYQYRTADPSGGSIATIGLGDAQGDDPFDAFCNNNAEPASAQSAICLFDPAAQPQTSTPIRLSEAVQSIGTLAPGASTTVELPFVVESDAACVDAVKAEFIAAVDAGTHSFNRTEVLNWGLICGTPVTGCGDGPGEPLPTRRGLYFNAQRPGNGLNGYYYDFVGHQQIFGGLWYTAFGDRTPTWYETSGVVKDYAGALSILRYENIAAPSGFNPQAQNLGTGWIGRIDDDSLLLAWQFGDGSVGAERMDSIGLPFAPSPTNHTQAWYNPAEPGWGVAIESLDVGTASGFEFFAQYLYDSNGVPRWLAGDKATTAGGSINMKLYSSQCPACAWFESEQGEPKAAGTLAIDYAARNSASVDSAIVFPAPVEGSWTRNQNNFVPIADPVP